MVVDSPTGRVFFLFLSNVGRMRQACVYRRTGRVPSLVACINLRFMRQAAL